MEFHVSYFKILKDDAVKCCTQYVSKFGKLKRWPEDWKKVFIPVPKKDNGKECSNYQTIAFISHASKVIFKILQDRLQQYMNPEFPDVQVGFRKGRGTRDQIANIHWLKEKARELKKKNRIVSLPMPLCGSRQTGKNLQKMGIPDHFTCLLRNMYAGQEATVRTKNGTKGLFKIGKGVWQGCILSSCLFNLYAEYNVKCRARLIISWNYLDWSAGLPREISTTSDMEIILT